MLELWAGDEGFRSFFLDLLRDAPFDAYYWETPSIDRRTVDREFEMAFVDAPGLAAASPEPWVFAGEIAKRAGAGGVAVFPNLGGDAELVVPRADGPHGSYTHLAAFVRGAPEAQQQALWRGVARAAGERLGERPTWISTSGAGVSWLHVRLDSRPKYYQVREYRSPW